MGAAVSVSVDRVVDEGHYGLSPYTPFTPKLTVWWELLARWTNQQPAFDHVPLSLRVGMDKSVIT